MALDRTDLQTFCSALVKKVIWIGAYYALLVKGNVWIPAIIDSFEHIGQNASGLKGLGPGDVLAQGINIAGSLLSQGSLLDWFTKPGTSFFLGICGDLVIVSYALIALSLITALIESYLTLSVGYIFLGFGGSRWTASYTERYIGLAISTGIRIMLLYLLTGGGLILGARWATEAADIGKSATPLNVVFDVVGGSVLFLGLCWNSPKALAAVLGGAPAFSSGDFIAPITMLASTVTSLTAAVASLGSGGTTAAAQQAVVSATRAAAAIGTGAEAGKVAGLTGPSDDSASAARRHVPPPSTPPSNGSGGRSSYVPPPGYPKQNGSGSGSLANAAKEVGRAVQKVNLHDGAQVSPPQMPINHHDD